jgi:hypothetical protein
VKFLGTCREPIFHVCAKKNGQVKWVEGNTFTVPEGELIFFFVAFRPSCVSKVLHTRNIILKLGGLGLSQILKEKEIYKVRKDGNLKPIWYDFSTTLCLSIMSH